MTRSATIRVMISSRCNDPVSLNGQTTFSGLRRKLKAELEGEQLFGSQLFDVWINEDAPPAEGDVDAWEKCLNQVRQADILLVLYNGNSGWARQDGDIGICHAELATALSVAAGKVRIICMPLQDLSKDVARQRHERFRKYVDSQRRFWVTAKDGLDAIQKAKAAIRDSVPYMVQLGVREASKGQAYRGAALDWSRLDLEGRRRAIANTLRDALTARVDSVEIAPHVVLRLAGASIVALCHAVPASMSVSAAREMVGQPFLHDHEASPLLTDGRVGPVHFIGCHRSITEAQAMKQLGFSDATIVSPPFGVFVADNIQRIQLLFLANCRDETSTRHAIQRAFDWLEETGEDTRVSERAAARARIVKAVARENQPAARARQELKRK